MITHTTTTKGSNMKKVAFFKLNSGVTYVRAYHQGKAYTLVYVSAYSRPYNASMSFKTDYEDLLYKRSHVMVPCNRFLGDDVYFGVMRQFKVQEYGYNLNF